MISEQRKDTAKAMAAQGKTKEEIIQKTGLDELTVTTILFTYRMDVEYRV